MKKITLVMSMCFALLAGTMNAQNADVAETYNVEAAALASRNATPANYGTYYPSQRMPGLIYDNGPLETSPTRSTLQTNSLGMTFIGFGHQGVSGNSIADDFTFPQDFELTEIKFYAYQTGSSTTSTFTGITLQVWDGVPGAPGSTVVWGDTTTNVLDSSSWSGLFRDTETSSGDVNRPIMELNVLTPGLTGDANATYWLDWNATGTLGSGPWAPPVTVIGQATTGNALQSTDTRTTWNPANDGSGARQDFPFQLMGTLSGALACANSATMIDAMAPGSTYTATANVVETGIVGQDTDEFTIDSIFLDDFRSDTSNELIVTLISPAGTELVLMANRGGLDGLAIAKDITFTDGANDVTTFIDDASFSQPYAAEGGSLNVEMMSVFEDESITGDWIIEITNGGNSGGNLNNFCINLTDNGLVGTVPTISCPMDVVVDNDPGVCGAEVTFADAAAVDTEDGALAVTQTAGLATDSVFPVGVNTVTFEATDSDGNTVECSFTITVNDIDVPTMECPADIMVANDAGVCGANITVPAPTVMDNCPTDLSPVVSSGNVPLNRPGDGNLDFITVTIPSAVPSTTGSVTVDVVYNGDFSFTTESLVLIDENGDTVLNVGNTGTDCQDFTAQFSYTETDWNDLVANFGPDLDFEVQPNAAVNDFCADSFVNLTAKIGERATLVNDFNGSEDASGMYPVGTTTVTYTYTDPSGNSVDCSFDVVVEDTEAPVIMCEGEINDTVSGTDAPANTWGPAPGTNNVLSTITIADSQLIVDANVDLNINHTWVGDLQVTLTSPAGTSVLIYDGDNDGCSADDLIVTLDDEAAGDITACDPGATGNAYPDGAYAPSNALSAFDGEDTMGDWILEVDDSVGGDGGTFNSWTLNLMYDAVPLPPYEAVLDVDGLVSIDPADLLISASDNCGAITVSGPGSDPCNEALPGNALETGFFNDAPRNLTVANDFRVAADVGIATLSQVTAGIFHGVGATVDATVVTYYEDAAGLPGAVLGTETVTPTSQTIVGNMFGFDVSETVYDLTPFDFAGQAGVETIYWVGLSVNASDAGFTAWEAQSTTVLGAGAATNFSGAFEIGDPTLDGAYEFVLTCASSGGGATVDYTCADVGINTVNITVTDDAGNEATCEAVVDVVDNIAPTLVCADFTLELDDNGVATLDPSSLIDTMLTIEACGLAIVTADVTAFDCSNIGTPTLVTIFAADPSGNIASCSAMVDVVDVNGPVLTCPGDQMVEADAGTGQYIMEDFVPMATATDGCTDPVTVIAQDPAVGTALGVGTYTVTLTAQDDLGNESTCTFQLEVGFLGTQDNELDAAITMYPNPATDIVNLANNSTVALERAAIYDVNGKLVSDINLDGMIGERAIDVSALASGVYIVQISAEGAAVSKRLIIE